MSNSVIGALRANLGLDSAQFNDGLKQAQSSLSKFAGYAKTGLMAAAAAGTAAVGALSLAVKGTIDAADDMSKAALKVGIPIEELSRLKYAADLSGVSFEGLQTSVGRLSRQMNDAKNGLASAAEPFEQLGIAVTNADGSLRSSSDVMKDIADRFATMPEGAEKTALAMELMGRSGANMIPMLNGGSEALGSLMAEAETFGQVFTQEMGSSAEAFNDNISRLTGTLGSLTAQITADLLPYLEQFSNWLVENAPQIRSWASTLIEGLTQIIEGFRNFMAFFREAGESFRAFIADARTGFESLKATVQQVAADILAAFKALPGQMLQIGRDIMAGLKDGITSAAAGVAESAKSAAMGAVNGVKSFLRIQSPSRVMYDLGVYTMEGLGNGMDSMSGTVESSAQSIASTVSSAFSGIIDGAKTVRQAIGELMQSLAKMALDNAFRSMFGGGGLLGGIGGILKGGIGKLFGFAQGGQFQVGGAGGIDSQLVAFRASPNETVSITKPGQERHGGMQVVKVVTEASKFFDTHVQEIAGGVSMGITRTGLEEQQRGSQAFQANYAKRFG